ncbi:hypothetical protein [Vibrio mediterranei]|uniref:hypothetical protein n=1 Tax=Vibrio mediterranei TaxID=689 RepID=UPI004067ED04
MMLSKEAIEEIQRVTEWGNELRYFVAVIDDAAVTVIAMRNVRSHQRELYDTLDDENYYELREAEESARRYADELGLEYRPLERKD